MPHGPGGPTLGPDPTAFGWAPGDAPAPTAEGRARGALVGGAAALVALALVGATAVVVLGRSSGPVTEEAGEVAAWDPRVAPIAAWVEVERDLSFAHPVEVVFQPESEYLAAAEEDPSEADQEALQAAEEQVGAMRALGLVHGEVDLAAAGGDLAGEGTLAYYSYEEAKVYVRGTELTPGLRVTLAHELTHVLQDQHFDLARIADPDFDRVEGLRAMAEGDAGRIEDAYAESELTAEERAAYEEESISGSDQAQATLDDTVPPALVTLFSAPYALGESFVAYLERVDGPSAIDDVLRDPPSEEELLHPGVRGTPRAEEEEVDGDAPDGAEVLDEDSLGPLVWYLLLASRGEAPTALRIVDGWAGDHLLVYRDEGQVCAQVTVVGDDQAATQRFRATLEVWVARSPGFSASVEGGDEEVTLRSCDPGADAAAPGEVSPDLLAIPFLRSDLESGFLQTGATPERASCAADQLLDAFTLQQLTDPAAATDPAVQAQIQAAVAGCA